MYRPANSDSHWHENTALSPPLRPIYESPRGAAQSISQDLQFPPSEGLSNLRNATAGDSLSYYISWHLREQCLRHQTIIRALHVEGDDNIVADLLSRLPSIPSDGDSDAPQMQKLRKYLAALNAAFPLRQNQIESTRDALVSCNVQSVSPLECGHADRFLHRVLPLAVAAVDVSARFVRVPIVARHFPRHPTSPPVLLAPLTGTAPLSGPSPYEANAGPSPVALRRRLHPDSEPDFEPDSEPDSD